MLHNNWRHALGWKTQIDKTAVGSFLTTSSKRFVLDFHHQQLASEAENVPVDWADLGNACSPYGAILESHTDEAVASVKAGEADEGKKKDA